MAQNKVNPANDFSENVVIVTGANSGIGYETVIDLAKRGATVIMACRDRNRAEIACNRIKEITGSSKVVVEDLELADLESVRRFAKRFKENYNRLDILINNAGLAMCPYSKTKDGFETQIGVNHLGHFLLTNLLLDLLKKSAPSRIINVSSEMHQRGVIRWDDLMWEKEYSNVGAYCQSKLANVLFTIELAKVLKDTKVTAVSLHPGVVDTGIFQKLPGCMGCLAVCCMPCLRLCFKTQAEGAETTVYCAISPDIPDNAGAYYSDSRIEPLKSNANEKDAKRLWDMSAKLVNL